MNAILKLYLLSSPSIDSDDDDFDQSPRELQTGSSDDEEQQLSRRAAIYITSPSAPDKTTTVPGTAGKTGPHLDKMEIDNGFGNGERG